MCSFMQLWKPRRLSGSVIAKGPAHTGLAQRNLQGKTAITHLLKYVLLSVVVLLGACADQSNIASIRPGIGSDVNLNLLRPPSGVTYQYATEFQGVTQPATMVLRARRIGAKRYRYSGDLVLTFPPGANLEEGVKSVARVFKVPGFRARGSQIFIPVSFTTDNRFRSSASSYLIKRARHRPHDCFAVLGSCTYRDIQEGGQATIRAETTEAGGIWTSRKTVLSATNPIPRDDRTETLTYSLDKNGVIIDLFITNRDAGRRVTSAYRRKVRER